MAWSLHYMLRDDPHRRCVFGITIENTSTRVWFALRSVVVNTVPFDFIKVSHQKSIAD